MAKKQARKRQAWNKGLEVGKRDGFTPDQVKQIRGFLPIVASVGSEIWLSFRQPLIPCCTDKTCSLLLSGMCKVAMAQSVKLLKFGAQEACRQCGAPCPGHPRRRSKDGGVRPAKSAPIL